MKRSDADKLIAVKTHQVRDLYKLGVGGWERGAETSECERQMRVMVRKGTGVCMLVRCVLQWCSQCGGTYVAHMHIYGIAVALDRRLS